MGKKVKVQNNSPQRARRTQIPPPVPLTEGDKGGGKNPYKFSVYSFADSIVLD